ncbi:hypothetical protein DQT75_05110 [Salmonella enterica subsp. enterica]|nr:hypothetical protein [Salmonella enterica subsp. enterica]
MQWRKVNKKGRYSAGGGIGDSDCGSELQAVDYSRVPSTLVGGSPKARKTKAPETLLLTEAVRFFLKQEKG